MSGRVPYHRFFWGDYLRDTLHLSTEQHGAYLLLIAAYWTGGRPLEDDDRQLAATAKLSQYKWNLCRPILQRFFFVEGGVWRHNRLEKDLAEATRAAEISRKNGSRGGRPPKPAQKPEKNPPGFQNETQRVTRLDVKTTRVDVTQKKTIEPDLTGQSLTKSQTIQDIGAVLASREARSGCAAIAANSPAENPEISALFLAGNSQSPSLEIFELGPSKISEAIKTRQVLKFANKMAQTEAERSNQVSDIEHIFDQGAQETKNPAKTQQVLKKKPSRVPSGGPVSHSYSEIDTSTTYLSQQSSSFVELNTARDPPPAAAAAPLQPLPLLDFLNRLFAAAGPGLADPAKCGDLHLGAATVGSWIRAGCDFEFDVEPVVRAKTANPRASPIRSWSYFTQAVLDQRDRRLQEHPNSTERAKIIGENNVQQNIRIERVSRTRQNEINRDRAAREIIDEIKRMAMVQTGTIIDGNYTTAAE